MSRRRRLIDGTAWGLLAEGLALPTGLVTVMYLTRALGAQDYGLYVLTIGVVMMIQGGIESLLSRASIKFVSQEERWEPVATTALRLNLGIGLAAAIVVMLAAPAIAGVLHEPRLAAHLRLFAWALPAESIAQAHLDVLVARSVFRKRAVVRAWYWSARLLLIVGLVAAGYGIQGALVGALGASAVAVLASRWAIQPRLLGRAGVPVGPMLAFALPLFIAGAARLLSRRLDVFALTALGGRAEEAGLYGAAQTLAFIPGLLTPAFAPLLLASMNQALHQEGVKAASALARDAIRATLLLFPFAGLIAGASHSLASLAYGVEFEKAGDPLMWLAFAGMAVPLASTLGGILIVADRSRAVLVTSIVPLVVAGGAYPFLIPRWGMSGAAIATLLGVGSGITLAWIVGWKEWRLTLPIPTILRSLGLTVIAFVAATSWISASLEGMAVLGVAAAAVPALFIFLGEARISAVVRGISAEWKGRRSATKPSPLPEEVR